MNSNQKVERFWVWFMKNSGILFENASKNQEFYAKFNMLFENLAQNENNNAKVLEIGREIYLLCRNFGIQTIDG